MIEKVTRYFKETLWNFSIDQKKGMERFSKKWLRILYLSIRSFYLQSTYSASSLTYFTLMSIVPLLALILAVFRGFGLHDLFQKQLLSRFPDQTEAFSQIFKYADVFLKKATGGIIAAFGFGVLFLSVLFLLHNLEEILNRLWNVKKHRNWKRILTDYFAILLILPIFFVIASTMTVFAVEYLESGLRFLHVSRWLIGWLSLIVNVLPYCLFWLLFLIIYVFMPNTKVRFRSAAIGALIGAILYIFAQGTYIYFQVGAGRYGAIYGTMAALPLFLFWLQISWYVVLFGAHLTWAHQTYKDHEYECMVQKMSASYWKKLCLWVTYLAIKREVLTLQDLVKEFHLPLPLAKRCLQELVECHILLEGNKNYVPSKIASEMKVSSLLKALENNGENDLPFVEMKLLNRFNKIIESFEKKIEEDPENIVISNVPDSL